MKHVVGSKSLEKGQDQKSTGPFNAQKISPDLNLSMQPSFGFIPDTYSRRQESGDSIHNIKPNIDIKDDSNSSSWDNVASRLQFNMDGLEWKADTRNDAHSTPMPLNFQRQLNSDGNNSKGPSLNASQGLNPSVIVTNSDYFASELCSKTTVDFAQLSSFSTAVTSKADTNSPPNVSDFVHEVVYNRNNRSGSTETTTTRTVPAKKETKPVANTSSYAGKYMLLAGSYLIEDNAKIMVKKLKKLGIY